MTTQPTIKDTRRMRDNLLERMEALKAKLRSSSPEDQDRINGDIQQLSEEVRGLDTVLQELLTNRKGL